jgi:hypothetical protein
MIMKMSGTHAELVDPEPGERSMAVDAQVREEPDEDEEEDEEEDVEDEDDGNSDGYSE